MVVVNKAIQQVVSGIEEAYPGLKLTVDKAYAGEGRVVMIVTVTKASQQFSLGSKIVIVTVGNRMGARVYDFGMQNASILAKTDAEILAEFGRCEEMQ